MLAIKNTQFLLSWYSDESEAFGILQNTNIIWNSIIIFVLSLFIIVIIRFALLET